MMNFEPTPEHLWLQRIVGEWTFEGECSMGPDQPPMKSTGNETVRSLGNAWVLGESEIPGDGGIATNIITLGYDPKKQKFVGTFVASVMPNLWVYEGSLDADQKILTLDTIGPSFTGEGLVEYQDIIEILSDDHRTLSSQVKGEDGNWTRFMTGHYRRKK